MYLIISSVINKIIICINKSKSILTPHSIKGVRNNRFPLLYLYYTILYARLQVYIIYKYIHSISHIVY